LIPVGEDFSNDNEFRLYRNDAGALVDVGQLPVAMKGSQLSYANAVAGDFDGDGDCAVDLAVISGDGVQLYRNALR
jgi:hypothetical protein